MTGEVTILPPPHRDSKGKFQPGYVPKTAWTSETRPPTNRGTLYYEAITICREATPDAARKLVELMECGDRRVELIAAQAVYDRAYGKPKETAPIEESARPDLSNLSDKDLVTLRKLLAKMATRKAEPTEAPKPEPSP